MSSRKGGKRKDASAKQVMAKAHIPTIDEIVQDPITGLANDYWAPGGKVVNLLCFSFKSF